MQQRTVPGRLAVGAAWVLTTLLVVAAAQWSQRRDDPAAVPGVRIAAVLLLEADARITAAPTAHAGERAERAALVRRTWDDAVQRIRLNRSADPASAVPGTEPGGPARFVVSTWRDVTASPHRAQVELVGHYAVRDRDGVWRDGLERTWRLRLSRLDPVGRTRGWRLVSIG